MTSAIIAEENLPVEVTAKNDTRAETAVAMTILAGGSVTPASLGRLRRVTSGKITTEEAVAEVIAALPAKISR